MTNTETLNQINALFLIELLNSDEWRKSNEQISRAAIVQRFSREQKLHIREGYFHGRIPSKVLMAINMAIKDKVFSELDYIKVGTHYDQDNFFLIIVRNGSLFHHFIEEGQRRTGDSESQAIKDHGEIRLEEECSGKNIQKDFSLYEIQGNNFSEADISLWKEIQKVFR